MSPAPDLKMQIIKGCANLYGVPDETAPRGKQESELLFGEIFTVFEQKDGWCRGENAYDGYAGYVRAEHLSKTIAQPTHVVSTLRTHIYKSPSIKTAITYTLSLTSEVAVAREAEKGFVELSTGGFVYAAHLSPALKTVQDFVEVAAGFIGTPYVWGGRSSLGIDCSGLVQIALKAAGVKVPRDTEQQEAAIGGGNFSDFKRGDIVFFPGHVGIMADAQTLLHANAHHMKVVMEPLKDVLARSDKGISSVSRV